MDSAISRPHNAISGAIPTEETATTTTTVKMTSAEPATTGVATDTTSPGETSASDLIMIAAGSELTEQSGTGINSPEENDKVQNTAFLKWIILELVAALMAGGLAGLLPADQAQKEKGLTIKSSINFIFFNS